MVPCTYAVVAGVDSEIAAPGMYQRIYEELLSKYPTSVSERVKIVTGSLVNKVRDSFPEWDPNMRSRMVTKCLGLMRRIKERETEVWRQVCTERQTFYASKRGFLDAATDDWLKTTRIIQAAKAVMEITNIYQGAIMPGVGAFCSAGVAFAKSIWSYFTAVEARPEAPTRAPTAEEVHDFFTGDRCD